MNFQVVRSLEKSEKNQQQNLDFHLGLFVPLPHFFDQPIFEVKSVVEIYDKIFFITIILPTHFNFLNP